MDTITAEQRAAETQLSRRPKRGNKRLAFLAAALVVVSGAAWYGHHWWTFGRFVETTDDAYVGGDITPLAPHVDAFIDKILVEDNQFVHAGQVLIRLDQRDYQAARSAPRGQVGGGVQRKDLCNWLICFNRSRMSPGPLQYFQYVS